MEYVLAAVLAVAFVLMTAVFRQSTGTQNQINIKGRKIHWERLGGVTLGEE